MRRAAVSPSVEVRGGSSTTVRPPTVEVRGGATTTVRAPTRETVEVRGGASTTVRRPTVEVHGGASTTVRAPTVEVRVDSPPEACPDPTVATYLDASAPIVVVEQPSAVAWRPAEPLEVEPTPPPEPRRTRGHLSLDVGPTRIHGAESRVFRGAFEGRIQFRHRIDLDLGYALLADGETTLGLGRLGAAVRVLDGTYGFLRLGGSLLRMRDSLGAVNGGELTAGLGFEARRFSTLLDASVGRLGESRVLAVRWNVGLLVTRGLEIVLGLDHVRFVPRSNPAAATRLTTPTFGVRVLL